MSLLQQKVTLKDGRSILLRMVTLEDVDQISSYINEVRKDAPFILTDSRELKEISREQSLEFVQTAIKTGLFLIAVDGNEFVGNIDTSSVEGVIRLSFLSGIREEFSI